MPPRVSSRQMLAFAAAACGVAAACSSPSATISVTVGGEADALSRAPTVTTVVLDAVDSTGARQTLVTAPLTDPNVDLGDLSSTLVASLQLTGRDDAGDAVVFGATPVVELGALDGLTLPLFVQRKGELARMPGATDDARTAPFVATSPRGVYWAGGTLSGTSDPLPLGGYDLVQLDAFGATCPVTTSAESFALVELTQQSAAGDWAYSALIDGAGLTYIGLPSCTNASITTPPTGLAWADVARGATVMGDDGSAYVVGASRGDAASTAILVLKPDATASVLSSTSRQGAAAAWAPGRGVFLYGGSASGAAADVIGANGTTTSYCTTPDPTAGLAAIASDATGTMLVAGDGQRPRTVDLSSGDHCAQPWGVASNVPLASPSLFALGDGAFLLVGDDAGGATRVFRLDATSNNEIQLKIPRQGARAAQTATGAVVIVGGGSATPESYVD